jgi:hypothetical protein
MGGAQSSPEAALKVLEEPANYTPPLEVNPANTKVYFDLKLGRGADATMLGRVTMELKDDATPKTVPSPPSHTPAHPHITSQDNHPIANLVLTGTD